MPYSRHILAALGVFLVAAACGGGGATIADPEKDPPETPLDCASTPTIEDGQTPAHEIHVALDGDDDAGTGSEGRPFASLQRALQGIRPGDAVRIHPGTWTGGLSIQDVAGDPAMPVWIGGVPGQARPRIEGGTGGLHLVRAKHLVLHDLEVTGASVNGINCDDGGDRDDTLACHDLLFRELWIHDIGQGGNHDGLKLSGVNRYVVEGCRFENVDAGSGIDHVGCHEGVIWGCVFDQMGSNAIQCKGGTRGLLISRCTFERAGQRAVNIGGSTGFDYFRPPLSTTEPNAEARDVRVIANVFGECVTPFAFVGAVDCEFVNNTIRGSTHRWLFRVLQETTSRDGFTFLETQRCRIENNLFHFSRLAISTTVNVGPNTRGDTYVIRNNLYFAYDDEARSQPTDLPAAESGGIYGEDPFPDGTEAPWIGSDSPAAGAGVLVEGLAGDHDGRCYAEPPSIGAYEAPHTEPGS